MLQLFSGFVINRISHEFCKAKRMTACERQRASYKKSEKWRGSDEIVIN